MCVAWFIAIGGCARAPAVASVGDPLDREGITLRDPVERLGNGLAGRATVTTRDALFPELTRLALPGARLFGGPHRTELPSEIGPALDRLAVGLERHPDVAVSVVPPSAAAPAGDEAG